MFLESQQIIDYSLLMGLHFRAPEQLKALLEPPDTLLKHENLHQTDGRFPFLILTSSAGSLELFFLYPWLYILFYFIFVNTCACMIS